MIKLRNSEFVIEKLSIEASNLKFDATAFKSNELIPAESIQADFKILESEGDKYFKIMLLIKSPKILPNGYEFGCVAEGVFYFTRDVPLERKIIFLKSNGLPFVIAHVRSFLLNISSYSSGPPFILPAIVLDDFVGDVEKKQRRAEKRKINSNIAKIRIVDSEKNNK